jgi:hypothetical protein
MRVCIYCLDRKADDEFNREHVIPQAFGTFKDNLVLDCVCKNCNQYFANVIDLKLARDSIEGYSRYWTGIKPASEFTGLGPQSTTRVEFPKDSIQGKWGYTVPNRDGPELKVMAFPQIGLQQPPGPIRWFLVENIPEKQKLQDLGFERGKGYYVHVREMSTDHAREQLAAKGYGPVDDFVTTEPSSPETIRTETVGVIGRPERRAASKITFNYVAKVAGPIVRTAAFDGIRNFIRYDIGDFPLHISENPWTFLGPGKTPRRGHYLAAQTMPNGLIVAQVSLFLHIRYLVPLMTTPLTTGNWKVVSCHFFDIDTKAVTRLPVPPPPGVPGKQLRIAASETDEG